MPWFQVEVHHVVAWRSADIEADDAEDAIAQAIAAVRTKYAAAIDNDRQGPIFDEEFARYVVDPVVDGRPLPEAGVTYLDLAHLAADDKDRADGLPIYAHDHDRGLES
ncbi:MAG TPA: hypothetical protein VL096_12970 [Pirellulaceae bacterium]|nr:hypothetical protein [Pirellulaceae bacterium]